MVCEGSLSLLSQRKSMSRKSEATPTGSPDIWQERLPRHVHTHAHDMRWPVWNTYSHPGSKHQVRPGHTIPSIQPAHAMRRPVHLEVGLYPQQPRHLHDRSQCWGSSVAALRHEDPFLRVLKGTFLKTMWARPCSSENEPLRTGFYFHPFTWRLHRQSHICMTPAAPRGWCSKKIHMVVSAPSLLFASPPLPVSYWTSFFIIKRILCLRFSRSINKWSYMCYWYKDNKCCYVRKIICICII